MAKNPYEKHMKGQGARIKQQLETIRSQQLEIYQKNKIIEAFKIKNEFIYHAGRETMHVRIGSVEHKWIPGPAYFAATIKHIRNAKLDEKYNILLTHCFTNLSLVD